MRTIRMTVSITEKDNKGRYMVDNTEYAEKDFTFNTVSEAKEFILQNIYYKQRKFSEKYANDPETSIEVFTSKAKPLKIYCMNSEVRVEIQHNILLSISFECLN